MPRCSGSHFDSGLKISVLGQSSFLTLKQTLPHQWAPFSDLSHLEFFWLPRRNYLQSVWLPIMRKWILMVCDLIIPGKWHSNRNFPEAISPTLATWYKELTHWKRPWCWERLKAEGKGNDRGWDGWIASPTQWTWVWASSRSWWWIGKPGVLQSMGWQRVRHNWAIELN